VTDLVTEYFEWHPTMEVHKVLRFNCTGLKRTEGGIGRQGYFESPYRDGFAYCEGNNVAEGFINRGCQQHEKCYGEGVLHCGITPYKSYSKRTRSISLLAHKNHFVAAGTNNKIVPDEVQDLMNHVDDPGFVLKVLVAFGVCIEMVFTELYLSPYEFEKYAV